VFLGLQQTNGHPSHIGWRSVCCKPTLPCYLSITEIACEAHAAGNPSAGARPAGALRVNTYVALETSNSSLIEPQSSLPMLQTWIYGDRGERSRRGFVYLVRGRSECC
jgi:hypothetical protein